MKRSISLAMVLILASLLAACGKDDGSGTTGGVSSNGGKTNDTTAATETTAGASKTNNTSADTVISAISSISEITDIKAVTEDNDPNGQLGKQGGYSGAVFFSAKSITDAPGADSIEKGTDGGGCIEIYPTESDAQKRDEFLSGFDGTAFSSGSHKVVGTLVIRTSSKLKASEQQALEQAIVEALK